MYFKQHFFLREGNTYIYLLGQKELTNTAIIYYIISSQLSGSVQYVELSCKDFHMFSLCPCEFTTLHVLQNWKKFRKLSLR